MTAPSLTISVQPVQSNQATYLLLAGQNANSPRQAKLVLRLTITNTGTSALTLTGIEYAFPGSNTPSSSMQGVEEWYLTYYKDAGGATLAAGKTKIWTNGVHPALKDVSNVVFIPEPVPTSIEVRVKCAEHTDPATITLPLVAHESPVSQGAYLFPYSATDLRLGEYYIGKSTHWANGGANGTQIFAHDLHCEVFDVTSNAWSYLLPGKTGTNNDDYRIFGKPVHAMADGVVHSWRDDTDDNDPKAPPISTDANYIALVHGGERASYLHLKKGSIPSELKVAGAPVTAGQVVGLVGNSGRTGDKTSFPHIHIECVANVSSSPLRPLPFRNMYAIHKTSLQPPNPQGPWSKLTGHGIPKEAVVLWPAATTPAWYPPGWSEIVLSGVEEGSYQDIFDRVVSSGYRLIWLDGFEVLGKTYFNLIFRPSNGIAWKARHGMTAAGYQTEFDNALDAGYRLKNVTSYVSNGAVRYAAIFEQVQGPAFQAYHGITTAEHVQRFDALKKEGYRPVNISVTAVSGTTLFTGFYVLEDVGSFVHLAELTYDGYQAAIQSNLAAGRQLSYVSAYQQGSAPRFSAIFKQKAPGSGTTVTHQGLTGDALHTFRDNLVESGYLTRVIAGFAMNGLPTFAAGWRKP